MLGELGMCCNPLGRARRARRHLPAPECRTSKEGREWLFEVCYKLAYLLPAHHERLNVIFSQILI